MPYLSWISDKDLIAAVEPVVTRIYRTLRPERPYSIQDDSLHSIFENSFSDLASTDWRKYSSLYSIIRREITMQHERVLSSIPNWSIVKTDARRSFIPADVINEKDERYGFLRYSPIYGDGELSGLLASVEEKYQSYEFFMVLTRDYHRERIARFREPELESGIWSIVTLEEFYDVATGINGSLQQLYDVLPQVVSGIRDKIAGNPSLNLVLPQIFISYTRKNDEDLQKLKTELQSTQPTISVWTDEHLQAGTEDWQIALEEQIEIADCVVLLLTPECRKSKWVRKELNYAQQLNKAIIPFWICGNDDQVAMLNIVVTQRIDARENARYKTAISQLIRTIEQISRQRQNQ